MKVAIIDCREQRRSHLEAVARYVTDDVTAVAYLRQADVRAEVVLLHVGDAQQPSDNIEQVLARFRDQSWVVCYYGGAPVAAAKDCSWPNVAVFPASVDSITPGEDFVRTVQKVLAKWPERVSLTDEWFRETVTGFDPVLEAKLDVLAEVLKDHAPPADRLRRLRRSYRKAFDDKEELILNANAVQSTLRIRKIFFHEGLWEGDE
jgi:hypothetical protein